MKAIYILIGIILIVLIACHHKPQTSKNNTAEKFYNDASKMMQEMKYDSAIILLKEAFKNGLERPMKIVSDSNFYYFIDNFEYRSEIRNLLQEYSIENHSSMVRKEEPGLPILVKGKVRDESNKQPIENVHVELVHADSKGEYFVENTMWNPRLFSYLKTDENGEFSVNTILPGSYQDDDGNDVPAHIHFTLEANNYRMYASEFTFENDSIFKANGNVDEIPVALLKTADGQEYYQVTIFLQRE